MQTEELTFAEDELTQLMAVLVTFFAVILFALVVWTVLSIVAYWRIFKKAGEPGWKSLIPIYSNYVLYDKVWSGVFFWVTLVLNAVVIYTNPAAAGSEGMSVLQIVGSVCVIASMVFAVLLNYKTAKAFGKGIGFTLGLTFLQPVFLLILGFDRSQYQGPQ